MLDLVRAASATVMGPSLGPIVEAGVSFDRGCRIGYPRLERGLWMKRIVKKRMSNRIASLLVSRP